MARDKDQSLRKWLLEQQAKCEGPSHLGLPLVSVNWPQIEKLKNQGMPWSRILEKLVADGVIAMPYSTFMDNVRRYKKRVSEGAATVEAQARARPAGPITTKPAARPSNWSGRFEKGDPLSDEVKAAKASIAARAKLAFTPDGRETYNPEPSMTRAELMKPLPGYKRSTED